MTNHWKGLYPAIHAQFNSTGFTFLCIKSFLGKPKLDFYKLFNSWDNFDTNQVVLSLS